MAADPDVLAETNLDAYGHGPIPWSRPLRQLEAFEAGPGTAIWLSTSGRDGRTHSAAVGAVWHDGRFYFVSGPGTRKSRNVAGNPTCAIALSLPDIDLVLEGSAVRVTDGPTLRRLVDRYVEGGWPVTLDGDAFTAPYSAPSAGPPPWYLYEVRPSVAFGVATAEPHGAMRWRFGD